MGVPHMRSLFSLPGMPKLDLGWLRNKDWLAGARRMQQRMLKMRRALGKRSEPHPDDFFFSFEDLPYMGKEYWFLHFCSAGRREQVVMTFGRARSEVDVNNVEVRRGDGGPASKRCASVCWLSDARGQKRVAIDGLSDVSLGAEAGGNCLRARSGRHLISVCGKYPHFSAEITKDGRALFSARIRKPSTGKPHEFIEMLRAPFFTGFGAVMVNYYFKFEGRMGRRKLSGDAYLQKVVAILPLAPWNWVRVYFANGAVFDFFVAKPLGDLGRQDRKHFSMLSSAFLETGGVRTRFSGLRLDTWLAGKERRWLLHGPDFYLLLHSYLMQPFKLKSKTLFEYDEFLVEAKDFLFTDKKSGRTHTLADFGPGTGMAEDATGYLL